MDTDEKLFLLKLHCRGYKMQVMTVVKNEEVWKDKNYPDWGNANSVIRLKPNWGCCNER